MSNLAAIVMHDTKLAAKREQDAGGDLAAQFRAACKAAKSHWLVTDPNEQLVSAIAGLQACQDEETAAAITAEARNLGRLSAIIQAAQVGVPLDWERMEELAPTVVGIGRIWSEEA